METQDRDAESRRLGRSYRKGLSECDLKVDLP